MLQNRLNRYLLYNNFIKKYKNAKLEHSYIINNNGELVLNKMGSKNQIRYSINEQKYFYHSYIIHNHPFSDLFAGDSPVSLKDIAISYFCHGRELITINQKYIYILKPNNYFFNYKETEYGKLLFKDFCTSNGGTLKSIRFKLPNGIWIEYSQDANKVLNFLAPQLNIAYKRELITYKF